MTMGVDLYRNVTISSGFVGAEFVHDRLDTGVNKTLMLLFFFFFILIKFILRPVSHIKDSNKKNNQAQKSEEEDSNSSKLELIVSRIHPEDISSNKLSLTTFYMEHQLR